MRVVVVGLRATGAVVARWLGARGDDVVIVEETPGQPEYSARRAAAERAGQRVLEGAVDWTDLLVGADLLVPSPGVRPEHPAMVAARALGVPVRGDLDLAVEAATMPVAVVSGTNGKSTVTTLVSAMLEHAGRRAPAIGNIGRVALDALDDGADVLVVEASSFQLHTVGDTFAPDVAVLLNLAEDHLDWHGSFDAYAGAKANMFRHQHPDAVLVTNLDDPRVVALTEDAPARRVGFAERAAPGRFGWDEASLLGPDGLPLLVAPAVVAPHERANLAAAAAAATALGAPPAAIAAAQREFVRLHHRTEPVGKAGDVLYVDDSKATNPHAAAAAVRGYPHVVLLAGGDSKGVDLGALREVAARLRGVVAIGDTPEEVERALGSLVTVRRAATMRDAVSAAAGMARPGDTVLLSPACASFDWYDSYASRGDDFRREVTALLEGAAPTEVAP